MRPLAVLALTLAGCASMHGPLDVITPDELTIGRGSGTHSGEAFRSEPIAMYEGESESTYAALTWDIPSFQDPMRTREERREIRDESYAAAVALDEEESQAASPLMRFDKTKIPPAWLLVSVGLVLAFLIWSAKKKARRSTWR